MKQRIWLTDEQQKIALDCYQRGDSIHTIADSLGVCTNNIYSAVRKLGGTVRNRKEAATRLFHWEQAFNKLTPEAAYWIGFLFADGWINETRSGPVLHLVLAQRDAAHVHRLRSYLRSQHKVTHFTSRRCVMSTRTIEPRPMVRFALRSTSLCEALGRYGMRKKSLVRTAAPEIAMSRDFWRGLMDGDGYVIWSVTKNQPRIGLCGGRSLMQQFVTFLHKSDIGHDISVRSQKKDLCVVATSCGTATDIIRLLYRNAAIYLDRKMKIAERVL